MIDYEKLINELEEEKMSCQYSYGGMVPAFYSEALRKGIRGIKKCRDCAVEAARTRREERQWQRT